MAEVTLEMLQALSLRVLDEQKETRRELGDLRREMRDLRRDVGDVRQLTLALSDKVTRLDRDLSEKVTRLDRSIHEMKDDIWIMLKAELMGRQGNYETRIDARLDEFAEQIAALSEPKP